MDKAAVEWFLFGRYGVALAWPPHVRDAVREALATTVASYNAGLLKAAKICADLEVTQDMCMGARRATLQACEKRILAHIEPVVPRGEQMNTADDSIKSSPHRQNITTESAPMSFTGTEPAATQGFHDVAEFYKDEIPAAPDSRVTLTKTVINAATWDVKAQGQDCPIQLGQEAHEQCLAAIDLQAEVERLKFDNEQLSVTSVNLLERAERAEAALKPVSEEQIVEISLKHTNGGDNLVNASVVRLAMHEGLRLRAECGVRQIQGYIEGKTDRAEAALKPEGDSRWKVFCALCNDTWDVPYHHPGKSICEACEKKAKAKPTIIKDQVVARVWNAGSEATAVLNSAGRQLPDDTPLYTAAPKLTITEAQIRKVAIETWIPRVGIVTTRDLEITSQACRGVLARVGVEIVK